jgi:hypothetical protein
MTDCANGEIRDLLPDWIHGTLGQGEAARVATHVAGCALCASEAALLRTARRALSRGARVDVARIAAAVTRPGTSVPPARRTRAAGWRLAAGLALAAAGAGSVAVFARRGDQPPAVAAGGTAAGGASAPGRPTLTLAAGIADLSDVELERLAGALDELEAAPAIEPGPVLGAIDVDAEGAANDSDQ